MPTIKTPITEVPNPSSLTQTAIDKSIDASHAILTARIDGIVKAQELFQNDLTRVPTTVDRQIVSLREMLEQRFDGVDVDLVGMHKALDGRNEAVRVEIQHLRDLVSGKIEELASVTTERFLGVAAQFSERDTRTDQRAGDTKLAVDAAFAAAKEATSKIEMGFTKSIDGQQELMNTNTRATDEKISDLKDRVTAMENRTVGMSSGRVSNREDSNDNRSNIAIIISIAGVLVLVLLHFMK